MKPSAMPTAENLMRSPAARAQVMQNLTGSDTFGLSITVPAGFLVSEDSDPKADPPRIVPAEDVTLYCAPCLPVPLCLPSVKDSFCALCCQD